jgi:hypothetical protein
MSGIAESLAEFQTQDVNKMLTRQAILLDKLYTGQCKHLVLDFIPSLSNARIMVKNLERTLSHATTEINLCKVSNSNL